MNRPSAHYVDILDQCAQLQANAKCKSEREENTENYAQTIQMQCTAYCGWLQEAQKPRSMQVCIPNTYLQPTYPTSNI